MLIINDFKQRSEEWFAYKLGKFGASDAQAVASNGKGLETLCFAKVAERLTGKSSKEEYTNENLDRGNELEDLARNSVELEYGKTVQECGLVEMDKDTICSPDGLVGDDGMIEIKCPSDRVFLEFMYYKKIDTKYVWQMQMQMLVADRKWVDYCVFNPNFPKSLIVTRVVRDEEAIEKIRLGLEAGVKKIAEIQSRV